MSPEALSELISSIAHNLVAAGQAGALTDELIPPVDKLAVMRPKDRAHGDWASNIAMQLAKKAGMKPRDLAEPFAAALAEADGIAKVEVAGPGFINITLDSASAAAVVDTVLAAGAVTDADKHLNKVNEYGRNDHLGGQTLNLEFVSANPTGPIHIGGTRWAAVGDAMARVLEANGAKVVREYYFNDHGEQINRFAKSLVAAWAEANNLGEAGYQTETPCDGYKGAYINEIAARVQAEAESDGVDLTALAHQDQGLNDDGEPLGEADTEVREEFRKRAVPMMFDEIQKSMKDFRVNFDVWFHENSLYADGKVDAAIEELKSRGDIFDKDGATWFESTKHGDDKDRVIIKSNGEFAYFAADIAYYWDKRHRAENSADVAIYMLGADHHGYIGRMMAMCAAFGDEPGKNMQILIGQLVNVMKDGKAVRMSKRAGNVVTIDDLVSVVGVDAARYSLARSDYNQNFDIDLALLASHTNDNPGVLRAVRARPLQERGPQRSRCRHQLRGCRPGPARHRGRRRSARRPRPIPERARHCGRRPPAAQGGPLPRRTGRHLSQVVQRRARGADGPDRSGNPWRRRGSQGLGDCQEPGAGPCRRPPEAQ